MRRVNYVAAPHLRLQSSVSVGGRRCTSARAVGVGDHSLQIVRLRLRMVYRSSSATRSSFSSQMQR